MVNLNLWPVCFSIKFLNAILLEQEFKIFQLILSFFPPFRQNPISSPAAIDTHGDLVEC